VGGHRGGGGRRRRVAPADGVQASCGEAALSLPAGELGAERVELRQPEALEGGEPVAGLARAAGVDRVQTAPSLGPDGGEAVLAQDAQVLGDGRLADPELLPHDLADLARAQLPVVGEELEDPSPHRIAEDVERMHATMLRPIPI
jgi:hypothetical protein